MKFRSSRSREFLDGLDFEGQLIEITAGDTVAAALHRGGVRIFSRSFKFHRPRGLYCMSGDCPNCVVNVDGVGEVKACVHLAQPGQRIRRETGWPSADHDCLSVLNRLRFLLPVGFYYKTLLRPRWLWPFLEPWIRRLAGRAPIQKDVSPAKREAQHIHPDVVVIGAGPAGLAFALEAGESGQTVLICDEGRIGGKLPPGSERDRVFELAARAREHELIDLVEDAPAIGVYEGPLVVLNAPRQLYLVHPNRAVVATGAVETHAVFPGNDLPGVWLGRGAALLAGRHGISPGKEVVLVGRTQEAATHAHLLRAAGANVTVVEGTVVKARGSRRIRSVVIDDLRGTQRTFRCDALALSVGLIPRDSLARQGAGLPVVAIGDAATPGLAIGEVEAQATRLARVWTTPQPADETSTPTWCPRGGVVCLCEDVSLDDFRQAWKEGFQSTELLKRYTTATMGTCQGQLCHSHLREFVTSQAGAHRDAAAPTTARPPARGITLEEVSAGVHEDAYSLTTLHDTHVVLGASIEPVGHWRRPQHYGDPVAEYWAVRQGVSVMDVGTLGKFIVAGPDANDFVERLYPNDTRSLALDRVRYALLLGEHGFVVEDGLIIRTRPDTWYLTFTSSGAATMEACLKDWADVWGHRVYVIDMTATWGAINLTGPQARELLQRLTPDPVANEDFPYLRRKEITVAGVPCDAIRLGFVGELSYELHHPSSRSVELWNAIVATGSDLGLIPHGLDALRLLRLEKGHIIIGQDTDLDSTPAKLNMNWAVDTTKPWFVGKQGLERAGRHEMHRKLVTLSFPDCAPPVGSPLIAGDKNVGYLTSSDWSPTLKHGVALGWIERQATGFPESLVSGNGAPAQVVRGSFYDPEGVRLRG